MAGFIKYQRTRIRQAWADATSYGRRNLLGTVIATVAAFFALPAVSLLPGATVMQEGLLQAIYGLVGPAILFSVALLIFWGRAGSKLYTELETANASLENRLRPTLRLSLPDGGTFSRLSYGSTITFDAGNKQTRGRQTIQREYLVLPCRNTSDVIAQHCEAHIIKVIYLDKENSESGEVSEVDAIRIPWLPMDETSHYVSSIPPRGVRHLLPVHKLHNFVYFHTDNMPSGYIHMFDKPGIYILTISVGAVNCASAEFTFLVDRNRSPIVARMLSPELETLIQLPTELEEESLP